MNHTHSAHPSWEKIRSCTRCALHQHQSPLLEQEIPPTVEVMWVGLSAKLVTGLFEGPLCRTTKTGQVLERVEEHFPQTSFYRTNLVKCPPIKEGKLRYPNSGEMAACQSNLELEISRLQPKIIFLLGKLASTHVLTQFRKTRTAVTWYQNYPTSGGVSLFPVPHPSYIAVYRSNQIEDYIASMVQIVRETKRTK